MVDNEKIKCTVEVLTLNSERTLPALLKSIKDFEEIIVLDGGSTDKTLEIAKNAGCVVLSQTDRNEPNLPISDFSAVRNKGLFAAKYPWFLFVDSDEVVSPELTSEIRAILNDPKNECIVYEIPRKYIINGTLIEHSITYPAPQTRFFRKDGVTKFIKPVHEKIEVLQGTRVCRAKNAIIVPQEDIFFPKKWFHYLEIESKKYKNFSFLKCFKITLRRLALTALYLIRYIKILILKKNRAPWKFEASYIVYNFVHIYYIWRAYILRGTT